MSRPEDENWNLDEGRRKVQGHLLCVCVWVLGRQSPFPGDSAMPTGPEQGGPGQ